MTPTPYDIVREACVKANQSLTEHVHYQVIGGRTGASLYANEYRIAGGKPWGGGTTLHEWKSLDARDIRLADVLLAIIENKNYIEAHTEWSYTSLMIETATVRWNLRHDSLEWHRDNQPETVEWLAGLLTSNANGVLVYREGDDYTNCL